MHCANKEKKNEILEEKKNKTFYLLFFCMHIIISLTDCLFITYFYAFLCYKYPWLYSSEMINYPIKYIKKIKLALSSAIFYDKTAMNVSDLEKREHDLPSFILLWNVWLSPYKMMDCRNKICTRN